MDYIFDGNKKSGNIPALQYTESDRRSVAAYHVMHEIDPVIAAFTVEIEFRYRPVVVQCNYRFLESAIVSEIFRRTTWNGDSHRSRASVDPVEQFIRICNVSEHYHVGVHL